MFCVKTPGDDAESVRVKSEGQDAWVPRHDTVPGAGGSQCSGTEDREGEGHHGLVASGKSLCPWVLRFLHWIMEGQGGTQRDNVRVVTRHRLCCYMDLLR